MTIIKEDIVLNVMNELALDHKIAKKLIESILRNVMNTLASGEDVIISGFGGFKVHHKKPRIGRNPRTKVEHEISERKVVTFSPSRVLRNEMNMDQT